MFTIFITSLEEGGGIEIALDYAGFKSLCLAAETTVSSSLIVPIVSDK
jgi:hypothetical protein